MISRARVFSRFISSLLVVSLLAACVHGGSSGNPVTTPANPNVRNTTHVFVGNCVFRATGEAFLGALLAAVLPSLISQGFNRLGSALEAAGKEHAWQATGFTNFEVSKKEFPQCVQVVRGLFASAPSKGGSQDGDAWAKGTPYELKTAQLKNRGIYLTEKPDFFFEGVFRHANDGTVVAIVPIVTDFRRAIGNRALRNDPKRHVTLTFAFHPPGKSATDATNPSTNLVLGGLSPGAFIEFDHACAMTSSTAASGTSGAAPVPSKPGAGLPPATPTGGPPPTTPGAPAPQTLQVARTACADESLWVKLSRPDELTPLSLTVAVSEVQGANEFLTFLSDVFKGSKDELEKLAKVTLIESEREKARLAAFQAANEASVAYDKAATTALTALETCRTTGTIANAGDARVKQQSANLAAEKAGRSQPFTTLVPLTGTAEAIQKACRDALTNFK